jgi:glutathione S-transferase
MKLYLNKTSPYARLVMVVAHEKALAQQIECVWTDPWTSPAQLLQVNPLAKVPALVTDGGQTLTESGCICDYLDDIGSGRRLVPREQPARLPVLRKYGLGRGLTDAAFGVTIQRRFAAPGGKPVLAERWLDALGRALSALEHDTTLAVSDTAPDLGDLALAVGLDYVGFRLPEADWRARAPRLVPWFAGMSARTAMQRTAPE